MITENIASAMVTGNLAGLTGADPQEMVWHAAATAAGTEAVHQIWSVDTDGQVWWLAVPSRVLSCDKDGHSLARALPGHRMHAGPGGYVAAIEGRDGVGLMALVTAGRIDLYIERAERLRYLCEEQRVPVIRVIAEKDEDEWRSMPFLQERMRSHLLVAVGKLGWRAALISLALPVLAGLHLAWASMDYSRVEEARQRTRGTELVTLRHLMDDSFYSVLNRLDEVSDAVAKAAQARIGDDGRHPTLRSFVWKQETEGAAPSVVWVAVLPGKPSGEVLTAFGAAAVAQAEGGGDKLNTRVSGRK
jgi:hypothetical protein